MKYLWLLVFISFSLYAEECPFGINKTKLEADLARDFHVQKVQIDSWSQGTYNPFSLLFSDFKQRTLSLTVIDRDKKYVLSDCDASLNSITGSLVVQNCQGDILNSGRFNHAPANSFGVDLVSYKKCDSTTSGEAVNNNDRSCIKEFNHEAISQKTNSSSQSQ